MAATVRVAPGMRMRKMAPKGAMQRRRVREFLMFGLPWIIGFAVFEAYPLVQSLWISFSTLSFSGKGVQFLFIGFKNYVNLFTVDTKFVPALTQAVIASVVEVPLIITFALTAGVLMKQGLFGTTFFRGLFFLPVVIGSSAVMSQLLGAGGVPLLISGRMMGGIMRSVGPGIGQYVQVVYQGLALMLWHSGVQVLLILAGLFAISPTYYEVARIDGASSWQTFLKVTLPCLSPTILLVTIYTLVDSFTDPLLNPVLNYIQQTGLQGSLNLGLAGAMGWVYFIVVFAVLMIIFRYAQTHVYYAGER